MLCPTGWGVGGGRVEVSFPSNGPTVWWHPLHTVPASLRVASVAGVQCQLSQGTSVVLQGAPGASPCIACSLENPLLPLSPIYLSGAAHWEASSRKSRVQPPSRGKLILEKTDTGTERGS